MRSILHLQIKFVPLYCNSKGNVMAMVNAEIEKKAKKKRFDGPKREDIHFKKGNIKFMNEFYPTLTMKIWDHKTGKDLDAKAAPIAFKKLLYKIFEAPEGTYSKNIIDRADELFLSTTLYIPDEVFNRKDLTPKELKRIMEDNLYPLKW